MPNVYLFEVGQFLDNSGNPLNGGKINTYAASTTTPQATYTDSTGNTLAANPIVLDSAGRANIWLTSAAYKFVIQDSSGNTLQTIDGINVSVPVTTIAGITNTGSMTLQQPTAATALANQSSNAWQIQGTYWNGSASAADSWQLQDVLGTGTNPTSTLTLTHSGSSGAVSLTIPADVSMGVNDLTCGTLDLTSNGTGSSTGSTAGGALNVVKASSPAATFMGRLVDQHGDTNAQLLGLNVEQMVAPSGSVNYQNSAYTGELVVPIGNSQNFTGNQIAADFAFVNYGSGTFSGNFAAGIVGESWNSGPATSILELDGVAGGAHNGSVTAGSPQQTPTGNGSVTNARGVRGSVSNSSSGTITTAAALHADTITNTGGGTVTTAIGLNINDQTAGGTNFAIKTGLGTNSFGDKVQANNTLYATGASGAGAAAFGTSGLLTSSTVFVGGSTATTGTTQFGVQIAPTLGGTTTSVALSARADVPASTTIATSIGVDIVAPTINSGGAITNWRGLQIEKAPTVGTSAHSIALAGSTSGLTFLDPPAAGSSTVFTLPATTGTGTVVIASGTSTLTANATLASVTSQTAITTAATGAATTDAIEWSYASAPTAGDSLCIVQPYVTSGNVNFVRSNPTAASQNVSAIVINWRVIR